MRGKAYVVFGLLVVAGAFVVQPSAGADDVYRYGSVEVVPEPNSTDELRPYRIRFLGNTTINPSDDHLDSQLLCTPPTAISEYNRLCDVVSTAVRRDDTSLPRSPVVEGQFEYVLVEGRSSTR